MFQPGSSFGLLPPVIKNLIIINGLVFLLTVIRPEFGDFLGLHFPAADSFQPFQFISFMFTHGGLFHFIFNMFALWMFGMNIEHIWGPKKFLAFYLACGIGSALAHLGAQWYQIAEVQNVIAENQGHPELPAIERSLKSYMEYSTLVGASGAVYGVLVAFGMIFANQTIMLLFPPIPMKAKYYVIGLVALDLFAGIRNNPADNVAHFAHLGGALVGFLILMYWRRQGQLYR